MVEHIHEHHDEGVSGALVFLAVIIALVVIGLLLWRFLPREQAVMPSSNGGGEQNLIQVNVPNPFTSSTQGGSASGTGRTY